MVGEPPPEGVVAAGVGAPLDGELPPLDDGVVAPLLAVPVPLVEVLLVEVVLELELAATAGGAVGTLKAGAPLVSVPVPPPPHAAKPRPIAMASATAGKNLAVRAPGRLMSSGPAPRRSAASVTTISDGAEWL